MFSVRLCLGGTERVSCFALFAKRFATFVFENCCINPFLPTTQQTTQTPRKPRCVQTRNIVTVACAEFFLR